MYEYESHFRKTGSNIRALREAFGETQLDLSLALNFDSPAAISMYESGSRGQNRVEVLEQIAWHYRITLDELLHKDFSWLQGSIRRLGDLFTDPALPDWISREKVMNLAASLFPAADVAPEDAVQILRQHLIRLAHASFPGFAPAFPRLCKNEISWIEFVRICWIRDDFSAEGKTDQAGSRLPALHELMTASGEPLLRILYRSESRRELAEYCQALQYVLGYSESGTDAAAVMAAGRSMIVSLAQMGNRYAEKLTALVHELHRL